MSSHGDVFQHIPLQDVLYSNLESKNKIELCFLSPRPSPYLSIKFMLTPTYFRDQHICLKTVHVQNVIYVNCICTFFYVTAQYYLTTPPCVSFIVSVRLKKTSIILCWFCFEFKNIEEVLAHSINKANVCLLVD